jgi:stearoyl-CoA desaturase (Delta-9 desaturase)
VFLDNTTLERLGWGDRGNVYYYRREANNEGTLQRYAPDLPYDRLDRVLLKHGALGFSLTGPL